MPNISENEVLANSAAHAVASTSTSNSVSQANASGANIDVSNTSEVMSSEPEDSYTPFTPVTEMIVTPNNSDASTSSSQAASKENTSIVNFLTSNANAKRKTCFQQERAREEKSQRSLTDLASNIKSIKVEEHGYLSCHK
eukprot:6155191-Ditylum_brightwellii.AAC.1